MTPEAILVGIRTYLPSRSTEAHAHFVKDNPSLEHTTWDEVLDELLQERAHSELTNAIYDDLKPIVPIGNLGFIVPVFLTLMYANKGHVPFAAEVAFYIGFVAGLVGKEAGQAT